MSSVLGVSVGAGAIRLARPPAGAESCAEPDSFDMRTFVVPPETPSAERAALSVAAALNSNPAITATVLACRDEQQARALHSALNEHGLTAYDIVPDIEAVLEFAVASGALRDVTTLAVFDLGSSGLSVTVVDVPTRQVRHTERTGDISGEYFDSLIREQQINSGRIAHPPDPAGLAELDALCRSAKERLSAGNAVALPSSYGPVLLTQENFAALIGRAVETSARATCEVIERSGRPVQALLAVGGGMRIPLVSRILREAVDMPILVPPEPETAAARGAALLAGKAGSRSAQGSANDAATAAEPRDRSAESGSRASTAPAPPGGHEPAHGQSGVNHGHSSASNPPPGLTAPISNAASANHSGTFATPSDNAATAGAHAGYPDPAASTPRPHAATSQLGHHASPPGATTTELDSATNTRWSDTATTQLGHHASPPGATTTELDSATSTRWSDTATTQPGPHPSPPSATTTDLDSATSTLWSSTATTQLGAHAGPPAAPTTDDGPAPAGRLPAPQPATDAAAPSAPGTESGATSPFGSSTEYLGPPAPVPGAPSAFAVTQTAPFGNMSTFPGAAGAQPGPAGPPSATTPATATGHSGSKASPAFPPTPGAERSRPDLPIPQHGIFGPPTGPPTAPAPTGPSSASSLTGPPSAPPSTGAAGPSATSPATPSPASGKGSNAGTSPAAPALPHPISTPVARLSQDEDPPTVALRLPAKLLPRRSFGEPPQRRNPEISAAMVAVSALVVVAGIGIGLGYGQHMFSKDSATVQGTSQPETTSPPAPSATTPPATSTTTSEHASLAEPPPVYQEPEPETSPPVTPGPNTWEVLPGLPPIVVPTIPPEALPFPGPRR